MVRRLGALAGVAIMIVLGSTTNAEALTGMQFGRVQYDPPGADTLNGEWIQLKNWTDHTVSLKGWTVRDPASHVYTFGTFSLGIGKTVTLYTGHGTNTSTRRYWNSSGYIWNNTGDTAVLKNASGTTKDTCKWTTDGAGYKNC